MKFDARGGPILSLSEKMAALQSCVADGCWEDVAGHLCDLLEYARVKIDGKKFDDLADVARYYGDRPTPIDEDGETL